MCEFKHWYVDENGYVIECAHCGSFQISFGTTMLTLDQEEFDAFIHIVSLKKESFQPINERSCKCILLPTPSSSVGIILCESELNSLYKMMQGADNEMKAQQLLALFN